MITCDCDDCLASDFPCFSDCDMGDLCKGCEQAWAELAEIQAEIDFARGLQ